MSSVNQRAARRWATERNRRAQLLSEILAPLYIRGTAHFDPAYVPEAQFPRWQVKP